MTHRPYLQRAAHVLGAVAIAFGILAAAPVAEAFRTTGLPVPGARGRVPLASPAEGDLIARLSVPRLALEAPVFEGIADTTLARGAGHLPGTALPGEEGGTNNSVLAIERDVAAAALGDLRRGDTVTMRTPFGVRSYRVVRTRILSPDAVDVAPTAGPRVTLVTPYPADAVGPAPMRMTVVLEPRK